MLLKTQVGPLIFNEINYSHDVLFFRLTTALDDAICHAKSETLVIPFGVGIGKRKTIFLNLKEISVNGPVCKRLETRVLGGLR